ncbi:MAG: acyltransferase [Candidatus Omnitrophota bacterium]
MYWDKWSFGAKARIVLFQSLYTPLKYLPFPLGEFLRFALLKLFLKKLGRGGWVRDGCMISHPENIAIGDRVFINENVCLSGAGGIEIGNNVAIGHRSSIISDDHGFENKTALIVEQQRKLAKVTIQDDVYFGCNVVVLKGVTIGKGAVIGAHSLVTKDIPEYAIACGIPAQVIRYRT